MGVYQRPRELLIGNGCNLAPMQATQLSQAMRTESPATKTRIGWYRPLAIRAFNWRI